MLSELFSVSNLYTFCVGLVIGLIIGGDLIIGLLTLLPRTSNALSELLLNATGVRDVTFPRI